MSRFTFSFRLLILTFPLNFQRGLAADSCYYPDGTIADVVAPCGGGQCCPYQYQCMSNGLCYNANADQYMRASCTDQTWQADYCPQICTQNNTASGNEAMLHCDSDNALWCCDGNRSWNCCSEPPQTFIQFPMGSSTGTITSTPGSVTQTKTVHNSPATAATGITVAGPGGGSQQPIKGSSTASHSSPKTHSSSQSSPTSKATTSTLTHRKVTTGQGGSVFTSTLVETKTSSPSGTGIATASNNPPKKSSSNLGFIVGLALGIPLFLIVIGLIVFCLYRRRRRTPRQTKIPQPTSPPMEASYMHPPPDGRAPELEGYPVAPKRTNSGRKSELEGDQYFLNSPRTPTTPASGPPQYSPAKTMTPITEAPMAETAPAELWGGYVPYRPPQVEQYRPPLVEDVEDSGT